MIDNSKHANNQRPNNQESYSRIGIVLCPNHPRTSCRLLFVIWGTLAHRWAPFRRLFVCLKLLDGTAAICDVRCLIVACNSQYSNQASYSRLGISTCPRLPSRSRILLFVSRHSLSHTAGFGGSCQYQIRGTLAHRWVLFRRLFVCLKLLDGTAAIFDVRCLIIACNSQHSHQASHSRHGISTCPHLSSRSRILLFVSRHSLSHTDRL